MKKKFLRNIGVVCITAITLSACSMFTTSLGANLVRDQRELFATLNASALAKMADNIESANLDTANAIMEALGNKKDELLNLPLNDKEAILDLALDTTIPIGNVLDIVDGLVSGETVETNDAEILINKIFDNVNEFDTTALRALLSDPETLQKADPLTLANAAIASIAQVAKKVGIDNFAKGKDLPDLTDLDMDPAIAAAALLPDDATPAEQADLVVALAVIKLLQGGKPLVDGETVERADIVPEDIKLLGVISLADILDGISGKGEEE